MTAHRHPIARAEARALVDKFDGSAAKLESELDAKLRQGELDEALRLDQIRREIERVYRASGI